ncbi:hypothetical protein [Prochlorococcus sp. MIT 0604]|uniref:hypothetical protein n=1 Tax=Prochlorococcus sp. MIT 0604 TaxID=1501268 RepID=UPI0004F8FF9C|nr:hypothetical protein [Prochlorococcus sp. MIT 0604]AIQ94724.1 hypothetical protein EW14_0704 [Prochlorococcus sp. MIT 0604]
MKLIENFAELLHSDQLPDDFGDWFIFEKGDEKYFTIPEKNPRLNRYLVNSEFWKLLMWGVRRDFWNKKGKKQFENRKKILDQIKVFPYFTSLRSLHGYIQERKETLGYTTKRINDWKKEIKKGMSPEEITSYQIQNHSGIDLDTNYRKYVEPVLEEVK